MANRGDWAKFMALFAQQLSDIFAQQEYERQRRRSVDISEQRMLQDAARQGLLDKQTLAAIAHTAALTKEKERENRMAEAALPEADVRAAMQLPANVMGKVASPEGLEPSGPRREGWMARTSAVKDPFSSEYFTEYMEPGTTGAPATADENLRYQTAQGEDYAAELPLRQMREREESLEQQKREHEYRKEWNELTRTLQQERDKRLEALTSKERLEELKKEHRDLWQAAGRFARQDLPPPEEYASDEEIKAYHQRIEERTRKNFRTLLNPPAPEEVEKEGRMEELFPTPEGYQGAGMAGPEPHPNAPMNLQEALERYGLAERMKDPSQVTQTLDDLAAQLHSDGVPMELWPPELIKFGDSELAPR